MAAKYINDVGKWNIIGPIPSHQATPWIFFILCFHPIAVCHTNYYLLFSMCSYKFAHAKQCCHAEISSRALPFVGRK